VAYAVQEELEYDAEVTVWTQGIFEPSGTTMQSLLAATRKSHAAVFVFTPDDVARIRTSDLNVARDNVVFELGLFIGAIGLEQVFFLIPRDSDLHLPSDLLGTTPLTFVPQRSDGNLRASVGPACNAMRKYLRPPETSSQARSPASVVSVQEISDTEAVDILSAWLERSLLDVLTRPRSAHDVDETLHLPFGTTRRLISQAVARSARPLRVAVNNDSVLQLVEG
jgi:hypothetical protein